MAGLVSALHSPPMLPAQVQEQGFQVEPDVKVPVTALLRVETSRQGLAEGHLRGRMEIYPAFEERCDDCGAIGPARGGYEHRVRLQPQRSEGVGGELAGFFDGNFFHRTAAQLVGLEPYRRGQIPMVVIHGTGSSSGRWANLINDLQSDPVLREGYQFWSFSYASGNPTSFSAAQLREVLATAVHTLDPHGQNPALCNIILIGHSQGGLLAKWLTIASGSQLWDTFSDKPPEALRLSAQSKYFLRQVFFVTPLPEIRRVIFIATPHHGSFVADSQIGQLLARFVTPRVPIMSALRDLTEDNPADLRFEPRSTRFGSVWSMTPANPCCRPCGHTGRADRRGAFDHRGAGGRSGRDGGRWRRDLSERAYPRSGLRTGRAGGAFGAVRAADGTRGAAHFAAPAGRSRPQSCVPGNARDRQPLAWRALDATA